MKPLPEIPLVSVVTPSFNTGRFIEHTLRSVHEQDWPRVEHIVLDSGSTDETLAVLARFPSVRLIRDAPRGLVAKMNAGMALAQGEIVAFQCADDYYLPGAITRAVDALRRRPDAGLVYCNFLDVDEAAVELARRPSRPSDFRALVQEGLFVPTQGAFMRREAFVQAGPVDERYPLVSDWDLWIRISKAHPIVYVDDYWGAARVRRGQLSDVHKYRFWVQARRMTRGHGAPFFTPLFSGYWSSKLRRGAAMLQRGDWRGFTRKLADLALGFPAAALGMGQRRHPGP